MKVLVTGGTGVLGREVVKELRRAGHQARVLSRKPGTGADWARGDLATGAGLESAVADMDVIVHAATAARRPWKIGATDVKGTARLLAAARRAHIQHVLYISIVGMEGVAYSYYRDKLAAEKIVREDIVPWSILRATQFHAFMEFVLGIFSTPPRYATVPLDWQFQPVDAREVAVRVTEVVAASPAGMLPDYGGPEVRNFGSLAESWLKARHSKKQLVNLNLPFKASRQFAEGHVLCPDHRDGAVTFEQYLVRRYGKW